LLLFCYIEARETFREKEIIINQKERIMNLKKTKTKAVTHVTRVKNWAGALVSKLMALVANWRRKKVDTHHGLSKSLKILIPDLLGIQKDIPKNKQISKKKEHDVIDALAAVFSVVQLLEHQHGYEIELRCGEGWFESTCEKANLIYNATSSIDKALLLQVDEEKSFTLPELCMSTSRTMYMKELFHSIETLISAVCQLKETKVEKVTQVTEGKNIEACIPA